MITLKQLLCAIDFESFPGPFYRANVRWVRQRVSDSFGRLQKNSIYDKFFCYVKKKPPKRRKMMPGLGSESYRHLGREDYHVGYYVNPQETEERATRRNNMTCRCTLDIRILNSACHLPDTDHKYGNIPCEDAVEFLKILRGLQIYQSPNGHRSLKEKYEVTYSFTQGISSYKNSLPEPPDLAAAKIALFMKNPNLLAGKTSS